MTEKKTNLPILKGIYKTKRKVSLEAGFGLSLVSEQPKSSQRAQGQKKNMQSKLTKKAKEKRNGKKIMDTWKQFRRFQQY